MLPWKPGSARPLLSIIPHIGTPSRPESPLTGNSRWADPQGTTGSSRRLGWSFVPSRVFSDASGKTIIEYSTEKPSIPPPELAPVPPPPEKAHVEEIHLRGHYALKGWNPERAVSLFRKALERDPGFTPALKALGLEYYKTGRCREALDLFRRALKRNEDDHASRFYRALCKIRLGIRERTEEDLYMVARRAAFRHLAPLVLASLAVERGKFSQAENLLRRALRYNPEDSEARTFLAAVLRHRGEFARARRLLRDLFRADPLNETAALEARLAGLDVDLSFLRGDPQYYLEAACRVAEMKLKDDAVSILRLAADEKCVRPHPFTFYWLGFFADAARRPGDARSYFAEGSRLSPDYVFPFRAESEAVLRKALDYFPEDWKLNYYLGTFLAARRRYEEALGYLLRAARSDPPYAVLHRNIGELYWKKKSDPARAAEAYEKALALDPSESSFYVALDRLYKELDRPEARKALFRSAPREVMQDFTVLLRKAEYFIDTGDYTRALSILRTHTFLPWEGWKGAHTLYVKALRARAKKFMEGGKYRKAIADIEAAMEYPENLGTGKPYDPDYVWEYFHLAECRHALGDSRRSREFYEKTVSETRRTYPAAVRMRAEALERLGKKDEAEKLRRKLGKKR